ncbi:hypothetical protein FRC07_010369 [Ceratobasidium sp. 392]|nr:hypothetical protein FRC07_010369 [Ceratobasidium sp. 392]
MLTLVKEAFRSLNSISEERISILAFIEEIGDTLEVSKGIWPDLLPELKRVTIVLDSASLNVEESESEPEDDDPAAKSQSQSQPHLEEDDRYEELSEQEDEQPDPVPGLLPPAPVSDRNIRVLHKIPTQPNNCRRSSMIPPNTLPDQPHDWKAVDYRDVGVVSSSRKISYSEHPNFDSALDNYR